jgi:hypothetical protein
MTVSLADYRFNALDYIKERSNTIHFEVGGGRIIEITATYLTPETAKRMLGLNTRNRKINRTTVERLKSDIANGRWLVTGETIKIANNGPDAFVGDAQHRLVAISESDIAVPVIIVSNIDPAATDIIDQNRTRAVKDILKMKYGHDDVANASLISAITTLYMECTAGTRPENRMQIAQSCDSELNKLAEWATWAKSVADTATIQIPGGDGKRNKSPMPPSAVGALAMHMVDAGGDNELVREFFDRVASGIVSETDKSNVIQAIRKRQSHGTILHRVALAKGSGGGIGPLLAEFAVYITAYNRWVLNERVELIKSYKNQPKKFADLPKVVGIGQ